MPRFSYQAIDSSGKIISGTLEAENQPAVLSLLVQRGIKPFRAEVEPENKSWIFEFTWNVPNASWRVQFFQELSMLLAAGIGLDRAMNVMVGQAQRRSEKDLLGSIANEINVGRSLSAALSIQNSVFRPDELGQIKAGELSGSLVPTLDNLAQQLHRRLEVQAKVKSALIYPAFLLCLAPISLVIIATILVPNLAPLFEDTKSPMPFALSAMMLVSSELRERWLLWLLFVLFLVYGLSRGIRTQAVQKTWDAVRFKLPFVGNLIRHSETARLCQILGALIQSGAPLQTALHYAGEAISSAVTRGQIAAARQMVIEGAKLASSLSSVRSLDKKSLQLISIGEQTNQLRSILNHISVNETTALETGVERLMTLLTPLLTILMGILVGGIVMSIMRAILSINQLASQ